MLKAICPKLPMRQKAVTRNYYLNLGFTVSGADQFDEYLMLRRDNIEIHFFLYRELNPAENYGQVYIVVDGIDDFFQSLIDAGHSIHPNGYLQDKPWGQREFSMLDPDNNLLTFGRSR